MLSKIKDRRMIHIFNTNKPNLHKINCQINDSGLYLGKMQISKQGMEEWRTKLHPKHEGSYYYDCTY